MISHPFEIKPSTSTQEPDVLMVTWRGTPAQSSAEVYLPAVQSAAITALADKMYGRHRITATDAHTIQFPAGDLTLIPIPSGAGRYAGLLTVELRPPMPIGKTCVVSVRQLHSVSATIPPPPPPIQAPKIKTVSRAENLNKFYWRELQGAFQYTIKSQSSSSLLSEQERLLGWLKWRVGVMPATNGWLPVLERYLKYTEILVWNLGGDPNKIPPSPIGVIVGEGGGSGRHPGGHGGAHPGGHGGGHHEHHEGHDCTGKVASIHYDRFGDFRGFKILTESGHIREFFAIEHAIEELVRQAWVERTLVRVFSDEHDPDRPDRIDLLHLH